MIELPDKIFKKGDILVLNEDAKRWDWSNDNTFVYVSHHLYYKDMTDPCIQGGEDVTVPENKLDKHKFPKDFRIQRWLLSVRCIDTGSYHRYAESFMEYHKVEMRSKKIKELIENEAT